MPKTPGLVATVSKGFFIPISLILVTQAAALHLLSIPERILPLPGLHELPFEIAGWKAAGDEALEPGVAEYLKPDEYIIRDYARPGTGGNVNLFLAYFRSLQNVYGPHSPSVCLPGAGWLVSSSKIAAIQVPGRAEGIPVNEYVMEKSGSRIVVIYWYQNNRDVWAEEFRAKLKMLPDLILYRRSDVSLVRLIAPIRDKNADEELASTLHFARSIFPLLEARFATSK